MLISADANQGFTTEQALTYIRAVKGSGLDFFEQPVEADDLAGMASVAAATDIAIGADEGIHSLEDIKRHHEHKAARGVSLKAIKLGGIARGHRSRKALRPARYEREHFLQDRRIKHCLRGGTACRLRHPQHRVGPDAYAYRSCGRRDGPSDPDRQRPVEGLDRPGLGIDVDEDRIRRHRVAIAARNVA